MFRNFSLVELSHLSAPQLYYPPSGGRQVIRERLNFVKNIINEKMRSGELKKGELVLIESPEKSTFRDYKKSIGMAVDKKRVGKTQKI